MIAVDTNVLVYAHREDAVWHQPAQQLLTNLAEGRVPWAVPSHTAFSADSLRLAKPPCTLNVATSVRNGTAQAEDRRLPASSSPEQSNNRLRVPFLCHSRHGRPHRRITQIRRRASRGRVLPLCSSLACRKGDYAIRPINIPDFDVSHDANQ